MDLHIDDEQFDDEARANTQARWERFMSDWLNPKPFNFTTFPAGGTDQIIAQTGIQFYSMCSHHLLPFFGMAHVGYLPEPQGRICGLSKLARAVEFHSRNFQTQEALTKSIACHVEYALEPRGVIVVLQGRHLCMEMRGVEKPGTTTTTSYVSGPFRDAPAKQEFFELMKVRM